MINLGYFIAVNQVLDIYTERSAGQNWQLMLPMLYNYPCITILEPMYYVRARANSHSRVPMSLENNIKKHQSYRDTIICTLKRMNMDNAERKKYIDAIKKKYDNLFLSIAVGYGDKTSAKRYYNQLIHTNRLSFKSLVLYNLFRSNLIGIFASAISKLNKLKKSI